MIDEETLAQINGKYVMPPDAGPAWKEAVRMGFDMSLIECNLELGPWERLLLHDSVLASVRQIQMGAPVYNGETH
jgi:hypothetical protein